jgi:putative drug exporter of the RND superfamily
VGQRGRWQSGFFPSASPITGAELGRDAPLSFLKMLATGLAAGILIDAFIVRALLVPALVSLFGRWNWILPNSAARLLRVATPKPTSPSASPSLLPPR